MSVHLFLQIYITYLQYKRYQATRCSGKATDLYSGDIMFESQSGHWLS
jgi:hypothetical protein